MKEIDLIPDEFRRKILFVGWFKKAAYSLLFITVLIILAFMVIRNNNQDLQLKINTLQFQRSVSAENRLKLNQFNQQKSALTQQLNLLFGLRSGASAGQMFVTIDRAIPGPTVWITNWNFRRAGTPVESQETAINTGYFIVLNEGNNPESSETWKIETNMSIHGQALDHVALAEFVLNLTQQSEIEDVRVVKTDLISINNNKIVDFNLEVTVSARRGKV